MQTQSGSGHKTAMRPRPFAGRSSRPCVACAMSGGVDSSVAALLLKRDGYDVVGVTLKLWECFKAAKKQTCCSAADALDARRVCEQLVIPHHTLDLRDAFRKHVVEYFVGEYSHGRTPNPCVVCNSVIKFGIMREECQRLFGTDVIATGHYARTAGKPVVAPRHAAPAIRRGRRGLGFIGQEDSLINHLPAGKAGATTTASQYNLLKGVDSSKDQSYFLWGLTQEQLSKTLFPVGGLTKSEVRKLASEAGIKTAEKRESQEVCFIPDNDYAGFMNDYYPEFVKPAGNFVDKNGKVLGRHNGVHCYTLGQRRGIGFGIGRRQFVVGLNVERNEVVLGENDDLMKKEMLVEDVNVCQPESPITYGRGRRIQQMTVKIRYRHGGATAEVEWMDNKMAKVIFDKPQRAITPGQSAVLYNGDVVLGGGLIAA